MGHRPYVTTHDQTTLNRCKAREYYFSLCALKVLNVIGNKSTLVLLIVFDTHGLRRTYPQPRIVLPMYPDNPEGDCRLKHHLP